MSAPLPPANAAEDAEASSKSVAEGTEAGSSKVRAGVTWTDRPGMTTSQVVFSALFFLALTAFVGIGVTQTVMKQNMIYLPPPSPCPSGWWRRTPEHVPFVSPFCLSPELQEKWNECQGGLMPDGTLIGDEERDDEEDILEDEEKNKEDLWDVFADNPHVTSVMGPAILVASAVWFFALKWFPLCVIYGTISISAIFPAYMAYLVFDSNEPKPAIVMCIIACAIVCFAVLARHSIEIAGRTASAACSVLKQRPTVFLACFVLKVIWMGLIACWFCFNVSGELVGEVVNTQLTFHQPGGTSFTVGVCDLKHSQLGVLPILSWLMVFITAFFEMGSVLICSLVMGGHYFDDGTGPEYPAFTGLAWTFTSSSGAVAESAMIMSFVTFCREYMNIGSRGAWACLWPCNPVWWVLKIIWYFVEAALSAMSRFKLIMHAFHGGGLLTQGAGQLPLDALQKHLGTAVVAEVVGGSVLPQSASLLATVLGLGTWIWLDSAEDVNLFAHVGAAAGAAQDVKHAQLMIVGLPLLMYICVSRLPKFTVLVFIFISTLRDTIGIARNKALSTAFAGFFAGAVAVLVLRFFVDIVFHSIDGLLYAYALEAETGTAGVGLSDDFRDLVKEAKETAGEQQALTATTPGAVV